MTRSRLMRSRWATRGAALCSGERRSPRATIARRRERPELLSKGNRMDSIWQLIIAALLGGVAILIVARVVPNFHLRGGFGSAVLVGVVYAGLKFLLQWLLVLVTLPAVLLTFGLFFLVINAFLLWMTDKLMRRVEINGIVTLLISTLLLTLIDWGFHMLLSRGALF